MGTGGHSESRFPDQILFRGGNQMRVAPGDADRQPSAHREAAFEKNLKCDSKRVEARAEIGTRAGNAQRVDGGQSVIMTDDRWRARYHIISVRIWWS